MLSSSYKIPKIKVKNIEVVKSFCGLVEQGFGNKMKYALSSIVDLISLLSRSIKN